jgi:hypothetical protein
MFGPEILSRRDAIERWIGPVESTPSTGTLRDVRSGVPDRRSRVRLFAGFVATIIVTTLDSPWDRGDESFDYRFFVKQGVKMTRTRGTLLSTASRDEP